MTDRIPSIDMANELAGMVEGKAQWLRDFSDGKRKRPDHEISAKQRELAVLKQAAIDYRRAADRDRSAA